MGRAAMLQEPMPRQPVAGTVRCTACEHWCRIAPGEAGRCGVRANVDGSLELLVRGRAAAVAVDPVEKKPLFHFLPGRPILSIGTLGCNLRCRFCQNWDISQERPALAGAHLGRDLPPEAIVELCVVRDIPMIAFTYNEPVVALEYAYDTFVLAKERGIRTVFVSSGFETLRALDVIEPVVDAINVDLKAFTDRFYRKLSGARLKPVLRNIAHIARETPIWIEVTTLLVPGQNDSSREIGEAADFLASVSPDLPWHLTAFHPDYLMLDTPPTPLRMLVRAWEIGKRAGLRHVYVGNMRDPKRESTWCPSCGAMLVARSGYRTEVATREPGTCDRCGVRVPGVWG